MSATGAIRPRIGLARPRDRRAQTLDRRDRAFQERVLFERYRARRDPFDREVLVDRFLPLAQSIAARFRHTREPSEDLLQVACLGLLQAIDRFDVDRRTAFSSFAVPTIMGELRRHFRDRTWPVHVPRDLQELALRVERATAQPTTTGGLPSATDVARRLSVDETEVLEARNAMLAYQPASLDAPRATDDEREVVDGVGDAERGYARAENAALFESLLRFLPARQREIVRLRFSEDLTQKEIGERVGLSQMQISRILCQATERLGEIVAR